MSEDGGAAFWSRHIVSRPSHPNTIHPLPNAQSSSTDLKAQDDAQIQAESVKWKHAIAPQTLRLGSSVDTQPLTPTKRMKRPREQQSEVTDECSLRQRNLSAQDARSTQINEGAVHKYSRQDRQDDVKGSRGTDELSVREFMKSLNSQERKLAILKAEFQSEELEVKTEELALKKAELRALRARVEQGTVFRHQMETLKYLKELTVALAGVVPSAELKDKIVHTVMRVLAQMER